MSTKQDLAVSGAELGAISARYPGLRPLVDSYERVVYSVSAGGSTDAIYDLRHVASGFVAPTGTLTRATFDTSSVTLPGLAERVAALITDIKALEG